MLFHVKVTKKMIHLGSPRSTLRCPVAMAVQALGFKDVAVFKEYIRLRFHLTQMERICITRFIILEIPLPEIALRWVEEFDNFITGETVVSQPLEFDIHIPNLFNFKEMYKWV